MQGEAGSEVGPDGIPGPPGDAVSHTNLQVWKKEDNYITNNRVTQAIKDKGVHQEHKGHL